MDTKQPIDDDKPIVIHSMSRKQLAVLYKLSDRSFRRRLERARLHFTDKVLLPNQIYQIIKKLGPWELVYSEPQE